MGLNCSKLNFIVNGQELQRNLLNVTIYIFCLDNGQQ